MPAVTIIGAGVAGLSAASCLAKAGWQVHIIEKSRGPGGRCATRRTTADPDSDWFDHGAQYFTARDPQFQAFVNQQLTAGQIGCWQPRLAVADASGLQSSDDSQIRYTGPQGLNRWTKNWLCGLLTEYANISCEFERQISEISKQAGGWLLLDSQQQPHRCSQLLITAPPEQSRPLLSASGVTSSLNSYQSDPCWAICLYSEQALSVPYDAIFFKANKTLSWAANNSSKSKTAPASALWTLHTSPDWSKQFIDAEPQWVAQQCLESFCEQLGLPSQHFSVLHQQRWRYARPAKDGSGFGENIEQKLDKGLTIAGDWLAGGRVEGAWLSGHQAAGLLITEAEQ